METPCTSQRRLDDDPFALTRPPWECARAPQDFLQRSHTPAQQGLLQEPCTPPIPLEGVGEARGRLSTPDERARQCSRARLPRTTNRSGGVTLPSDQC